MNRLLRAAVIFLTVQMTMLPGSAQILWQSDINQAVQLAAMSDRFIVIDFWASWCGPCLKMDREVWSHSDLEKVKDRFIFAKVDIDYNKGDATRYGVQAIPYIVVIDIDQNKYVTLKGYQQLAYMVDLLDAFPENATKVYDELEKLEKAESWDTHLSIAISYIEYSQNIDNHKVRNGFISAASSHFRKAGKEVKDDPVKSEIVEIYDALSTVYLNPKKGLKQLNKLYGKSTGKNEALFNYAFCSGMIEQGKESEARAFYEKVAAADREDLIANLDYQMEQ